MSQETWTAVDHYISKHLAPPDPILEATLESSAAAGLPAINVAPNQGKLLWVLAKSHGARSILEVGTLGGYSTIWLARALPSDGRLLTLEAEPKHAEVAQSNLARAGVAAQATLRVGKALDELPRIAAEGLGPFDLIFLDADKVALREYFEWAIKLSRPGTMIIADNVVRDGAVIDPTSDDSMVKGVRRLYDYLSTEPRVAATAIQTVGSKGYDGFAIALVL